MAGEMEERRVEGRAFSHDSLFFDCENAKIAMNKGRGEGGLSRIGE